MAMRQGAIGVLLRCCCLAFRLTSNMWPWQRNVSRSAGGRAGQQRERGRSRLLGKTYLKSKSQWHAPNEQDNRDEQERRQGKQEELAEEQQQGGEVAAGRSSPGQNSSASWSWSCSLWVMRRKSFSSVLSACASVRECVCVRVYLCVRRSHVCAALGINVSYDMAAVVINVAVSRSRFRCRCRGVLRCVCVILNCCLEKIMFTCASTNRSSNVNGNGSDKQQHWQQSNSGPFATLPLPRLCFPGTLSPGTPSPAAAAAA